MTLIPFEFELKWSIFYLANKISAIH
jgi:hypothetical protein